MEAASLGDGPAMDSSASASLSRCFERHLRAKNLSDGTVASHLIGIRQFTAFLQPHGRELIQATRADLEAFIGDLLRHWPSITRSAPTTPTACSAPERAAPGARRLVNLAGETSRTSSRRPSEASSGSARRITWPIRFCGLRPEPMVSSDHVTGRANLL
jgi:Phage integrase, N-terminal SAM-like domain